MKPVILFMVMAALGGQVWAQPGLTVMVKRGEGMTALAGEPSPGRIEVVVTDAAGKPAANATVTFSLPREGAAGTFSSGLSSESVMTASDGTASVSGIAWGDRPGVALIQIKASRNGETGAAVVTVELKPGTGGIRTISGRSGKAKWVIVAAAAGAALAGVALSSGRSGTAGPAGAVLSAVPPPPTVGAPSISIGRP